LKQKALVNFIDNALQTTLEVCTLKAEHKSCKQTLSSNFIHVVVRTKETSAKALNSRSATIMFT